jgi:hypothetical protein
MIHQLKLIIETKIPNHPEIFFTSQYLVYEGKKKLELYPFFTGSELYPRRTLQNLTYTQKIEFFFIQKTFKDSLDLTRKTRSKSVFRKKKFNENQIKFSNFILMLQLLFPTTFPSVNNISTSLSLRISKDVGFIPSENNTPDETNIQNRIPSGNKNISNFLSLKGSGSAWLNILPLKFNKQFSYMKINNDIYTISSVTWINDVMNHPVYSGILKTFQYFEEWKNTKFVNNNNVSEELSIIEIVNEKLKKVKNKFTLDGFNEKYFSGSNPDFFLIGKYNKAVRILKQQYLKNNIIDTTNPDFINDIMVQLMNLSNAYLDISNKGIFTDARENLNTISTKIRKYEINRTIHEYIMDLNFEYLNPEEQNNKLMSEISKKITEQYIEFDQFVKKIKEMSNRIIDNKVWFNVIDKIKKGESEHGFQELWYAINACYQTFTIDKELEAKKFEEREKNELNDRNKKKPLEKKKDYEANQTKIKNEKIIEEFNTKFRNKSGFNPTENVEIQKLQNKIKDYENKIQKKKDKEQSADDKKVYENYKKILEGKIKEEKKKEKRKEKKIKGGNSDDCLNSNDELNVGFDKIIGDDKNKNQTINSLIEIYLQMDFIKGKVDEFNMSVINCPYSDLYLGNKYVQLLKNSEEDWYVNERKVYFDATDIIEKYEKKKKEQLDIRNTQRKKWLQSFNYTRKKKE